MLRAGEKISDLIFSPGRAPQIESKGELIEVKFQGLETLTPRQTMEIAEDLLGTNAGMAETLKRDGSVDISYALSGVARFRVNIFRQRASFAIVMRVIPMTIPSFQDLGLPEALRAEMDRFAARGGALASERIASTVPAGRHVSPSRSTASGTPSGTSSRLAGTTTASKSSSERRTPRSSRSRSVATRASAGSST